MIPTIIRIATQAGNLCLHHKTGGEQRLRGRSAPEGFGGWFWCPVATIMRVIEAKVVFASFGISVACKRDIP